MFFDGEAGADGVSDPLCSLGIDVDPKEVQSIQRINGAAIVRLKDGSILTAPSRHKALNLGQAVILHMLAKRIQSNPLFDISKPLGLKLPKDD